MTPRTRTHRCPPDHPHGATNSLNCYTNHGCGCDECVKLQNARAVRYRKLRAYNRLDGMRVDAEPVKQHLDYLLAHGIGTPQIAKLTGVSSRTLQGIRQQRHPKMQKRLVAAVLGVRPCIENMAPGAFIPARGARRRIQALVAVGWTQTAIADMLGQPIQAVNHILRMPEDMKITVRTHREVADLYEKVSHLVPANDGAARYGYIRAVRMGQREGWVPPLAWDDIDTDPKPPTPPAIEHTVIPVNRDLADMMTIAAREVAVKRLWECRHSDPLIAQELGITPRTVLRIRQRLHLDPVPLTEQVRAA